MSDDNYYWNDYVVYAVVLKFNAHVATAQTFGLKVKECHVVPTWSIKNKTSFTRRI